MSCRETPWSPVALVLLVLGVGTLFGCSVESEFTSSRGVPGGVFDVEVASSEPTPVPTTTSELTPPPCGDFTVATTLFDTGSASLSPSASNDLLEVLDRQLALTCVGVGDGSTCPTDAIVANVVGHTDSRPNPRPGGNQLLSEQRARAIADLLAQREIDSNVSGVANQQPVSETDHEQNRRVQVSITCDTK